MKNFYKIFIIVIFTIPELAFSKNNIIYGKHRNQINLNLAASLRKDKITNSGLEKLYMFMLQYSQPDEFFRLQARKNFEILFTFGFNKSMSENNQFAIGISKDVVIPLFTNFYFGAGLGIYIKNKINSRIGSKFTFGQKYFIGFNLTDNISIEIFEKHISNGSITENNGGYDFLGLAASYIF